MTMYATHKNGRLDGLRDATATDFNCGGGSCRPVTESGRARTKRLQAALAKAADALGASAGDPRFLWERLVSVIGPGTATLATSLASRLPGADKNETLALFAKAAGATPPIALVADKIDDLIYIMEQVPKGTYGGVKAKSHKAAWILGGLLVAGGGVYLWRRHR